MVKNDSTMGRFFILKVSLSMIDSSSILGGYGFGGFKKYYMPFQAQYFKKSTDNEYNILADNISHPLNDFILFFIEQGMLFSILGLIILMFSLLKLSKYTPQYLCLTTIIIFAFFSYPFKYPLTLLMLAYALSAVKLHKDITLPFNFTIHSIVTILSIIWLGYIIYGIKNNYAWTEMYKKVRLGQFYK